MALNARLDKLTHCIRCRTTDPLGNRTFTASACQLSRPEQTLVNRARTSAPGSVAGTTSWLSGAFAEGMLCLTSYNPKAGKLLKLCGSKPVNQKHEVASSREYRARERSFSRNRGRRGCQLLFKKPAVLRDSAVSGRPRERWGRGCWRRGGNWNPTFSGRNTHKFAWFATMRSQFAVQRGILFAVVI